MRGIRRRRPARPEADQAESPTHVCLLVNGESWEGEVEPGEMLLDTVRRRMSLMGAKLACGRGECGACTVLVGGKPRMSCITPVVTVDAPVVTAEGLAAASAPLRAALADSGGFQCGYCTPGQVVAAMAVLLQGVPVEEDDVRREMAGNICRCTGYTPIVDAIVATARRPS
jgi:aerobic-type carbon monoxide dehydrogenase small subunit (CoxS/CutS family)